jgi:GNAT superfamily N-acetyltransferase
VNHRLATIDDAPLLAGLNRQLIEDEGHRNAMSLAELEQRMRGWLAGEYRAVLFDEAGEVVAYALYCERPGEIHLRQFFVIRIRRRQGIGRRVMDRLRSDIWPAASRLTVDVLVTNGAAIAFWRSIGFADYCLTLEIVP